MNLLPVPRPRKKKRGVVAISVAPNCPLLEQFTTAIWGLPRPCPSPRPLSLSHQQVWTQGGEKSAKLSHVSVDRDPLEEHDAEASWPRVCF